MEFSAPPQVVQGAMLQAFLMSSCRPLKGDSHNTDPARRGGVNDALTRT